MEKDSHKAFCADIQLRQYRMQEVTDKYEQDKSSLSHQHRPGAPT